MFLVVRDVLKREDFYDFLKKEGSEPYVIIDGTWNYFFYKIQMGERVLVSCFLKRPEEISPQKDFFYLLGATILTPYLEEEGEVKALAAKKGFRILTHEDQVDLMKKEAKKLIFEKYAALSKAEGKEEEEEEAKRQRLKNFLNLFVSRGKKEIQEGNFSDLFSEKKRDEFFYLEWEKMLSGLTEKDSDIVDFFYDPRDFLLSLEKLAKEIPIESYYQRQREIDVFRESFEKGILYGFIEDVVSFLNQQKELISLQTGEIKNVTVLVQFSSEEFSFKMNAGIVTSYISKYLCERSPEYLPSYSLTNSEMTMLKGIFTREGKSEIGIQVPQIKALLYRNREIFVPDFSILK